MASFSSLPAGDDSGKLIADCIRCNGGVRSIDARIYCASCLKLVQTEMAGDKHKISILSEKLSEAEHSLSISRDILSSNQKMMKATAEAASHMGLEELRLRAELSRTKASLTAWRIYHEHLKSRKSCTPCRNGMDCDLLKHLEMEALSDSPDVKCEKCEKLEAWGAASKQVMMKLFNLFDHDRCCTSCSRRPKRQCFEGMEMLQGLNSMAKAQLSDDQVGVRILRRLEGSVQDFSILGQGATVLFDGQGYKVMKVDWSLVPIEVGRILSFSPTLKDAINHAVLQAQPDTLENVTP